MNGKGIGYRVSGIRAYTPYPLTPIPCPLPGGARVRWH
jgi:hypothetical protein